MGASRYNNFMGEVSVKAMEYIESDPEITLDELYSNILEYFGVTEDKALEVYLQVSDVYKNS